MSRRRIRRLTVTILVTALVLGFGGYATAIALTPAPDPTVELTIDEEQQVDADSAAPIAAVDGQAAPTAVGWLDGEQVWANTDESVPIASLTKVATVLVALEQQPLDAGAAGPTHVWTEEDAARQNEYLAADGIVFPIPIGTEVTVREMLMLALIPSANDFAAAYAFSVFSDNDAFVAAVDDWAARHGLSTLRLVEPTGMDANNTASPADLVRLARLALANPVVAEIVAMPSATLPWGIGTVESTNQLHHLLTDVRGIKTGTTSVAGSNLLSAQGGEADGREFVKIAAVLAREGDADRVDSSIAVLAALDSAPQPVKLVAEGTRVGTATTVDGFEVPLVTDSSASTVLLPGESATTRATLSDLGAGAARQHAGTVTVASPTGDTEIAVVTTEAIIEPGYWWRFTHPGEVF